jgi:hypothetical protein
MSIGTQLRDLPTDIGNHGAINHAYIISERRCSDFGNDTHRNSLHISGA